MTEDYDREPFAGTAKRRNGPTFLYITSTLYRLTEIFEFAARLAAKGALVQGAHVSITLFGTDGRELEDGHDFRQLRPQICQPP